MIRKATTAPVGADLEFILSDETVDRYGDVVVASGWQLANFKLNPIALFNHNSNAPIGTWKNIRVDDRKLKARLVFADEGTSPRIDELRSLARQNILRAASVGFAPIEDEPLSEGRGTRYTKNELLEVSLVSVPANPAALALARSLHISPETQALAFGEHATEDRRIVVRGSTGEHAAKPSPIRRTQTMPTLAEKIVAAQSELTAMDDKLRELNSVEPLDLDAIEEQNGLIEVKQRALTLMQRSEATLGARSTPAAAPGTAVADVRRPFAVAAKTVEPKEYVYRAAVATALGHIMQRNREDVLIQRYGDDVPTRAVFEAVTKAATAPAMTTVTGWAAELVQTAIFDFIESMMPNSVYPGLSAKGGRFTFGRNGIVSLPSRSATPTIAGSFVGEGLPIPVRQGAFTAITLTPKAMKVITAFTRQILQHSTPEIERILREAIQEDTAVAIDTVLLDATAASVIRPAGLRNGVTTTTATAGGGFAALVGDIKGLMAALITASGGNLRAPVWIMNPIQAIAISMTQNAGGDFPFDIEMSRGNLRGYPVLTSTTVTAGMVILVDAADFFSATGDEPQFDISNEATLHMEDTTPLAIASGAQGSGVLATPTRSLFQTDSYGLRMMLDMNWAMRRTGAVAWTSAVTW